MLRPIDDAARFDAKTSPLVGGMFVKDADQALLDDLSKRGLRVPLLARGALLSALLALLEPADLHGARLVVHPHDADEGRHDREQQAGGLASAGDRAAAASANGSRATSTGRSRASATGVRRCRSGCATRIAAHREFIGSFDAAARERAVSLPENFDPHKPFIDELTWQCEQCDGTMRRTPEVIDVWFDSGSMPYAQWHYPFENQDNCAGTFPRDFICEGVDQTRGWFYSLMAISSMLGDGPAYQERVVNDLVLDAEGQKMSKSKGNVVDPWAAIRCVSAPTRSAGTSLTVSQPWVPKRFDPGCARRVGAPHVRHAGQHVQVLSRCTRTSRSGRPVTRIRTPRNASCWIAGFCRAAWRSWRVDVRSTWMLRAHAGSARDRRIRRRRSVELVRAPQPRPVLGQRR